MNALARRMARMIEMDGPIGVGIFMTLAMHDREMGFYAARESIGERGSFITAPEISQIFGELVALWCAQCWHQQDCPAAPLLVELGPGRGTLMNDMLRALRRVPDFLESLGVVLVEASAKLESIQRACLVDAPVPVHWARQWSDIASGRPLFVVANEFFDALPIRQFEMTERGWCERMVTSGRDTLALALSPQPVPLAIGAGRGTPSDGAVFEVCPAALSLTEEIGRNVAANGGAALIIDYGYEGGGFGDTLQAIRNHTPVDIFDAPGEADLSAHVDFSALLASAKKGGSCAHGPATQAQFLSSLGIDQRARQLATGNPVRTAEIDLGIARLTAADAMGVLFKVAAITPTDAPRPPGFEPC